MEWVDSSRCDLDQRESSRNLCDSKLQKFCAQPFQLQIIFALSIFETFVDSKVFTFNFSCAMTRKYHVGEIRRPSVRVKDVADTRTIRLWVGGQAQTLQLFQTPFIAVFLCYNCSSR